MTRYRFKGDQSPESVNALLAVFAEQGPGDGEIAHYVLADGGGGFTIAEVDSLEAAYEDALRYQQWMDMETRPILTIEDAMPVIGTVFG
ncbi:MAG TPA: DUF3303 family protein [Ilumatobacteraceae bacterium]|nr:DUF3303 family protein [Ilumatobacteraceae bacterium]